MSLHLIIGDKLLSSWSLRAALALELTGAPYTEELVKLGRPDTRERLLTHSPTAKVPLLKTARGTIADSLAIAEYLAEQFPSEQLWPTDIAARAQARSACAQMHSGFFAMRNHMPFNLSHYAPLNPVPPEVKVDIERMLALWAECRAVATEPGPYLFGRVSLADAFFAPIAVRLRTYQVKLPADDQAYVETVYQWPAFKAWQKAGLEELQS
ncbi:glutathione S-transferase family protein [Pseudomonas fluorescens]|uniref:Glutathione S-transferase family protein n=1 Tax=Pseudomonas fluorescens (strain Pf0-1) TaxID=205922 RepID=Q3K7U1_PSEPF|nr:glutathione S-transferase family protein [Pseudomonas fluorescens]ABA76163.1 glutathione S-transferase family protein [Pseudomonas fluorescens Pf0-1]MBY9024091.1 glutathione S-transferase family protein [Pseudomonas fluorescens]MBY9030404.1 glutathione S-transferase family protein [Pseudomonas fluorescens]MBY9035992.1 glutathione S-transferase family protein [Pseudomonas fluorescens]MBY9042294.1 glutathione S-transferase family protein [Pseudomonas fluorescens]